MLINDLNLSNTMLSSRTLFQFWFEKASVNKHAKRLSARNHSSSHSSVPPGSHAPMSFSCPYSLHCNLEPVTDAHSDGISDLVTDVFYESALPHK